MRLPKKSLIFIILLLLLGGIVGVQRRLTSYKDTSWFRERLTYLPGSDRIRPFLLGFDSTVAHYLWIKAMLYFGSHYVTDRDFTWLIGMVDIVTRLNPWFTPAYEFAGLMIPEFCNNPDAARVILQRGLTHVGSRSFQIPLYLGWLYHIKYNDTEQAAHYLAQAGSHPDAPPHIAALAATFYTRAGQETTAREFLLALYESSTDPVVRSALYDKLMSLPGSIKKD